MKLSQSWVGYLDRSYQQIKNSLIGRLVINNPEITDHNESNILIIIMSMFAGLGEMLNYYIDMMAREGFMGTAQRFTSVIKLAALIDYNARAKISATVNMLFYLTTADGNPYYTLYFITIPKGTIVKDQNGTQFNTVQDVQIVPGQAGAYSAASQWTQVSNNTIGQTNGNALQQVLLSTDIVNGTLIVFIDGSPWTLYASAGLMVTNTQGFIVRVLDDGNAYLIFGDGVNGMIPTAGQDIIANYLECEGADGNLPPGAITNITGNFTLPNGISLNVTNQDYASNGSDFESIEDVRNHAPRSIRTLERAVTYQDYKDVAILCPGVGDAEVSYCCGKYVTIYIVPSTIGVATKALISAETDWLNCRKMITTQVSVLAAGLSKIFLTATIYGKQLYTQYQILIEVINLLYNKYGFPFASINGSPSVSDMIAIMEGATSVDHVDIVSVQILPSVQGIEGNTTPLDITFNTLPKTNTKYTYTVIYRAASNQFQVYQGSNPKGNYGLEQMYVDSVISFTIHSANYTDGSKWQFVTVPSYPEQFPITKLSITDYSLPIMDIGPLVDANVPRTIYGNLTVVTQGVSSNCIPPCP